MHPRDTMSKIFRAALLIFATTFGIGLYALIGAPVLRIDFGRVAAKTEGALASAGAAAFKLVPAAHLLEKSGSISYALTLPSNDLPNIKSIVLNDNFGEGKTREIILTQKGVRVDGPTLIKHFSGAELFPELEEHLRSTRYFLEKSDEPRGTIFIETTGGEFVYPAMLNQEDQLAAALFALVHPRMSPSEIRMLTTMKFVSRTINGIDTRSITNSADTPILVWGLQGDTLVIAGDPASFTAATKK